MSSPVAQDDYPYLTERKKCLFCPREFSNLDHVLKLGGKSAIKKIERQYGDLTSTLISAVCPDCLERKPKIKRMSGDRDNVLISQRDLLKGLYYLFIALVFVSTIVLLYSLTGTLFNLPNFPFIWYIIIHIFIALFSFSYPMIRKTIKENFTKLQWIYLIKSIIIILFVSFLVPSFRNIFFSYLPTMGWKIAITTIFIIALYLEIQIINISLLRLFSKFNSFVINPLAFFLSIGILLCFMSPFYFGVIKMNPVCGADIIRAETVDKIYEEVFTATTADREIAHKYYLDGRQSASKGNKEGYLESIQFYKMALELIPKFSTAYAEMAYSYISIANILAGTGVNRAEIEEDYKGAEKAIRQANKIGNQNPSVFAVEVLDSYMSAKYHLSQKGKLTNDQIREMQSKIVWARGEGLKKLEGMAKRQGFTDKVFLTEATLTEDRVRKGSLLLTIIDKIDPDNAEVHNLLGLVYYQVNDNDSAKKMFDRAIRLSPDYGKAHINLALVSAKKEVRNLYKVASTKDKDSTSLAAYYAHLSDIMTYLRWFYGCLFIVWFVGGIVMAIKYLPKTAAGDIDYEVYQKNMSMIQEKFQTETRKYRLTTSLAFILTYGAFEIYINFVRPINGYDHLFPIRFPFF